MNPIAAIATKGFDLVDTNTDAKISRGEDTAANQVYNEFVKFDTSKDSHVTPKELNAVYKAAEVEKIMKAYALTDPVKGLTLLEYSQYAYSKQFTDDKCTHKQMESAKAIKQIDTCSSL